MFVCRREGESCVVTKDMGVVFIERAFWWEAADIWSKRVVLGDRGL